MTKKIPVKDWKYKEVWVDDCEMILRDGYIHKFRSSGRIKIKVRIDENDT